MLNFMKTHKQSIGVMALWVFFTSLMGLLVYVMAGNLVFSLAIFAVHSIFSFIGGVVFSTMFMFEEQIALNQKMITELENYLTSGAHEGKIMHFDQSNHPKIH